MSRGRGLGDKTFLTFLIYESELGVKITFKRQKGETFVADLAFFRVTSKVIYPMTQFNNL